MFKKWREARRCLDDDDDDDDDDTFYQEMVCLNKQYLS